MVNGIYLEMSDQILSLVDKIKSCKQKKMTPIMLKKMTLTPEHIWKHSYCKMVLTRRLFVQSHIINYDSVKKYTTVNVR